MTPERAAGRRELADELHALLFPEQHPVGTPNHDPGHVFWNSDDDCFQWSSETVEWIADAIQREHA